MTIKDILKASKRPDKETLEKVTANDKWSILDNAFDNEFFVEGVSKYDYYFYLSDYDDEYVYVRYHNYEESTSNLIRISYTLDGVDVVFGQEVEYVVATTQYEVKSDEVVEKSDNFIEKAVMSALRKFGYAENNKPVIKQANDNITVEYAYISKDEVDLHGDAYFNSEEMYKMVDSLNEHKPSGNYLHIVNTEDFSLIKAFVVEEETVIEKADGTTETIAAGTPMLEVEWHDESKLDLRKQNILQPPSIGARATIIDISGQEIAKNADIILGTGSADKSESNVKRLLKDITFDFPEAHVAMTSEEVGGPASGKDGYFTTEEIDVNKTKKKLSKDQENFLVETLGIDKDDLYKAQDSSSSISEAGEEETPNNTLNKDKEDTMSQESVIKMLTLCNTLTKFGFEGEGTALALSSMDEDVQKTILESFEFLAKAKEDEISALKTEIETLKQAAIEKAAGVDAENPILVEKGHGASPEVKTYPDTLKGRLQKQKDETLAAEGK